MNRIATSVMVLGLTSFLVACSDDAAAPKSASSPTSLRSPTTAATSTAVIATYEPSGGNGQALLRGPLSMSHGCLGLSTGQGSATLILFNVETTSVEGQTLMTADELGNKVSVHVGEQVGFGGGFGPIRGGRQRLVIPDACRVKGMTEAFYAGPVVAKR